MTRQKRHSTRYQCVEVANTGLSGAFGGKLVRNPALADRRWQTGEGDEDHDTLERTQG
jgi:hypothetical protein